MSQFNRDLEPRQYLFDPNKDYQSAADFLKRSLPDASGELIIQPTLRLAVFEALEGEPLPRQERDPLLGQREIDPTGARIGLFTDGLVIDDNKVIGAQVKEFIERGNTVFTAYAEIFTNGGMHIRIPYSSNRLALFPAS